VFRRTFPWCLPPSTSLCVPLPQNAPTIRRCSSINLVLLDSFSLPAFCRLSHCHQAIPCQMGGQRSLLYGLYTCTSHGSCLSSFGPPCASPLLCSLIASPTPLPLVKLISTLFSLYTFYPQSTPITHTHDFSVASVPPTFFSVFFLMGL